MIGLIILYLFCVIYCAPKKDEVKELSKELSDKGNWSMIVFIATFMGFSGYYEYNGRGKCSR